MTLCAVKSAPQLSRANVRLVGTDAGETGGRVALSVFWGSKVDLAAVADAAVFRGIGMTGEARRLAHAPGVIRAVTALAVGHIPVIGADHLTVKAVLHRWVDPAFGMDAGRWAAGHCGIVPNFTAGAESQQCQDEKAGDEQVASAPFSSEYTLHGALFLLLASVTITAESIATGPSLVEVTGVAYGSVVVVKIT